MAAKSPGATLCALYKDYSSDSANLDVLLEGVRKYALHVTRDEDIAQIATTRVWQHLGQYDSSRGSFAGWVRTISQRAAAKHHRKSADALGWSVHPDEEHLVDLEPRRDDEVLLSKRLREVLLNGPEPELVSLIALGVPLQQTRRQLGLTEHQAASAIRRLKNIFSAPQENI